MTIAPQNPSTRTPLLDMRCAGAITPDSPAALDDPRTGLGRCQLLAGHDGEHALMFGDGATRQVLAWTGHHTPHPVDEWRGLPWMRGLPFPAWFELGGSTSV